ncbi:hypothetical protein EI94DRAFT_1700818 [Lactarius quietus]|nr:hypothetical protein EI94DRAFT_1700818 [Lactarius quietus]
MLILPLLLLNLAPSHATKWLNLFEGTLRKFTLGVRKATEESAQKQSQRLDCRTLEWTMNSLNQDHKFERFFAGIPDFCNSRAVKDPMDHFLKLDDEQKLSQALIGFMHRTVTSHQISELAHKQRIQICTKAIDAVPTLVSWSTLRRVFGEWKGLLGSVDFGSAVLRTGASGDSNSDPHTIFCAWCIIAITISRAQVYDDRYLDLTTQFLTSDMKVWEYSRYCRILPLILIKVWGGVLPTLRKNLEHSSSAMLANLIFISRIIFRFHSEHSWDKLLDVSSRTLSELLSNLDVQLSSLEMQDKFCGLWNQLVHEAQVQAQAQDGTGAYVPTISTDILRHLRKSYIALHESTDSSSFYSPTDDNTLISLPSSSYPLCSVQDRRHTSPQTPHLATADLTNLPSSLSPTPDSIPPNVVAGATEDANDASNISSPVEASPARADRVVASAPTLLSPPLATSPSVEIIPTAQESQGRKRTPLSVIIDSELLASSDQSYRTFPDSELPSFSPDAGQ